MREIQFVGCARMPKILPLIPIGLPSMVSAEGHLAAAAAAFFHQEENELIAVPDALMLVSPAASIVDDHWPQVLLGTHAEAKDISLAENIKKLVPST
jgi:hypothetical protein